jgi:ParB family chromosome partitioning protein
MARKGILSTNISTKTNASAPKPKARLIPQGAVGALQSSLTRIQENAVQEIDPALIDDAGVEDRLGMDSAALRQLRESIQTYGQQVPVLLRPHPEVAGRYEIVYGRRRLMAIKSLGLPVKAMIRQLDDHALIMAQGQENTSRQDLSFIEKANFAAQLQDAGYDRPTIAAALSIDLPMVSRMLKVGTAFSTDFLRQIGSAPSIGRERWMMLVKLFASDPTAQSRAAAYMNVPDFLSLTSDERFEAVLARAKSVKAAKAPAPSPAKRQVTTQDGTPLADIKTSAKGTSLTFPAKGSDGFDAWINAHAETLVKELHDRWEKDRSED